MIGLVEVIEFGWAELPRFRRKLQEFFAKVWKPPFAARIVDVR